jgi:sulfur transfer complex TusBCD TusB component (DsrH family)
MKVFDVHVKIPEQVQKETTILEMEGVILSTSLYPYANYVLNEFGMTMMEKDLLARGWIEERDEDDELIFNDHFQEK